MAWTGIEQSLEPPAALRSVRGRAPTFKAPAAQIFDSKTTQQVPFTFIQGKSVTQIPSFHSVGWLQLIYSVGQSDGNELASKKHTRVCGQQRVAMPDVNDVKFPYWKRFSTRTMHRRSSGLDGGENLESPEGRFRRNDNIQSKFSTNAYLHCARMCDCGLLTNLASQTLESDNLSPVFLRGLNESTARSNLKSWMKKPLHQSMNALLNCPAAQRQDNVVSLTQDGVSTVQTIVQREVQIKVRPWNMETTPQANLISANFVPSALKYVTKHYRLADIRWLWKASEASQQEQQQLGGSQ
nr:uncharacterized protein LOC109168309 [Ipomoea batatas]